MNKINFFLILFISINSFSHEEIPFFERDLTNESKGIKTLRGKIDFSSKGMILSGDSKIKIKEGKKLNTANGSIDIRVIPPDLSNKTLLPLSSPYECYCAFKIRTGLGQIEISDRWIKITHLKPDLSDVDKELFFRTMKMDNGGMETDIRLEFLNRTLKFSINDMTITTLPFFYSDMKDVEFESYKHDFIITNLTMSELYRDTLNINFEKKFVEVAATYLPERFNNTKGLKNHHFIVWQQGKAAPNALFETYASDSAIYDALLKAGAKPGNNLSIDSWEMISKSNSKEPDKRVEGSLIKVSFSHGFNSFGPKDLLEDLNSNKFDFRFGGNSDFISHWRSGCVVCLQSCPGGKIGNHTYTMRDLHNNVPKFNKLRPLHFEQSDEITIRFTIID